MRCAHCGVHLPRAEARSAGGRHYCSEEHCAAGPRDAPDAERAAFLGRAALRGPFGRRTARRSRSGSRCATSTSTASRSRRCSSASPRLRRRAEPRRARPALLPRWSCVGYLVLAAAAFHVVRSSVRDRFNLQLSAHVCTDIVAIVLLMYASGGIRSGPRRHAADLDRRRASLVAPRPRCFSCTRRSRRSRCCWSRATGCSRCDRRRRTSCQPALLSIGYFATARVTGWLAQRVISQRAPGARARPRARQPAARQPAASSQDMQDGVLVLDRERPRAQHNPQAQRLLGAGARELRGDRGVLRSELARALGATGARATRRARSRCSTCPRPRHGVRARLVDAGVAEDSFAVVFVEDITRSREQAQQLKLAALGRLTANIAHEIRNPLSAISHAAELLREEEPRRRPRAADAHHPRQHAAARPDGGGRAAAQPARPRAAASAIRLDACAAGRSSTSSAPTSSVARGGFVARVGARWRCVEFDREHLHQVLWNLLRNAWRHAREGAGSVRLALQRLRRSS